MKLGVIGLPYSGKTTLFEAITGSHGAAIDHSSGAHMATITVPDERIDTIAQRSSPKKVTYAHVDFLDVVGVTLDQGRDHTVTVLSALKDVDGLVHVVRFFEWPSAPPHPRGSLDPERDIQELATELVITDLDIVEHRIERLEKQVIKPTPDQDRNRKELALMQHLKAGLEEGVHVSDMELTQQEFLLLRSFSFLSELSQVRVLNVHEDELESEATLKAVEALGPGTIVIAAKIEKELAELDPEERQEFAEDLGLTELAASRVIRASYEALGLRSFFTGTEVGEELRAWTVCVGDNALTAAGKIHSDIARGFIRAEVASSEDVEEFGSLKDARIHGKARLEGKEYVIQDGDVIIFRFKV